MKKIIFVLMAFGSVLTASAQHLSLSVNGGASIPTGGFSKGDYYDAASGFAGTGGHFNVTGTWWLKKHLGITALVGYSRFGNKGTQSLADGYKEDSGTDSTTLYRSGSNHSLSILIGPSYELTLFKGLNLQLRALGGYTRTHLAGFRIFYEDYTDNAMAQREASGGAFAWQAGVGLAYHLTRKLSVQINGDFFMSKPDIAISYDNFVVNSGRRLSAYNTAISGVNVTAGVAYRVF